MNKHNLKYYGIIAEYNPFHLGHKEQIRILKEEMGAELVAVVMSGHFLQRGIPALLDKWTRARMAVEGGADLVIELPVRFSLSSSDDFSDASLLLLSSLGVNKLCFGSEPGFLSNLSEYAERICEDPAYDACMRECLDEGHSYVKANELALSSLIGREVKLPPNALLGLSYCKSIRKYGLNIEAVPIERRGAAFHDLDLYTKHPSAESIRMSLAQHMIDWPAVKEALPKASFDLLFAQHRYLYEQDFYKQIVSSVFTLGKDGMREIKGVKEGLENKIFEAALHTVHFDEMLGWINSRRYTSSSIRRILFSCLLGIGDFDLKEAPELRYHRILAMSKRGRAYVSEKKGDVSFKPIVNFARDRKRFRLHEDDFKYDVRATAIYATQCESIRANSDYLLKPYLSDS